MTNQKNPAGSDARVEASPSGRNKERHDSSKAQKKSAESAVSPMKDRKPSDNREGASADHARSQKDTKPQGSSNKSRSAGR
ncbi:MAG: hypothetical protein EA398_07710 [Deltaproteobacteria bacterium]|nr:MAG: hypothetical protein EA398_07710 [Deltaproteobacteria bacterium]